LLQAGCEADAGEGFLEFHITVKSQLLGPFVELNSAPNRRRPDQNQTQKSLKKEGPHSRNIELLYTVRAEVRAVLE
jgi:hypothetical protein